MPFIVTRTQPGQHFDASVSAKFLPTDYLELERATVSRLAVATLEEARTAAEAIVDASPAWPADPMTERRDTEAVAVRAVGERLHEAGWACRSIPESGGTITLPDGMTVEVGQVSWLSLAAQLPHRTQVAHWLADKDFAKVLEAFNAKFAAGSPSTPETES